MEQVRSGDFHAIQSGNQVLIASRPWIVLTLPMLSTHTCFTLRRPAIRSWTLLLMGVVVSVLTIAAEEIVLREGLAVRGSGRMGRTAFHTDDIELQIVLGSWAPPRAGDGVGEAGGGNVRKWELAGTNADGGFTNAVLRGGYLYVPLVADRTRVMLLQASGHSMVYVNGEPRAGDVYQNGSVSLPVQLKAGTNHFLFASGRGLIKARLAEPAGIVTLDPRDPTLPDLVEGRIGDLDAAVIVVNSSTQEVSGLRLKSNVPGGKSRQVTLPAIPPLSTRKVGFKLNHSGRSETNRVRMHLELSGAAVGTTKINSAIDFDLRFRSALQSRRETFISGIEGSVQYYAVTPAQPAVQKPGPLALVLSTHGASVEAQGQADAYAPKTWAHVVAPTNRRPYGFDWEDWGRMDALEVLDIASRRLGTDPAQTYLTGHSMGGHGAWQLGVTFPDHFAAVAPSAGWISFFSYAGGRRYEGTNELLKLVNRAANPSDTLLLASNYLHQGIYILHGDADDNVPVREARTMRAELEKFHRDFAWHEQKGAGHWWGNACVDWPPIFDLFARRKIPAAESIRFLSFSTANPGISSSSHWIGIEAQQRALEKSVVEARWDPITAQFSAATKNVERLRVDLVGLKPGRDPVFELDGVRLTNVVAASRSRSVWFARRGQEWFPSESASRLMKGPHRAGPFKDAFRNRMIFVYGTAGTPEENAWAFAKARFDAESFWYRGNGSIDVVPDVQFDPTREKDRGVILYGNADSNRAWQGLLGASPVQVRRGGIRIGSREVQGSDLAVLFLRPRPGSEIASVGVVGGSGAVGMRLTDRVPYFMAGVAFPDCTVFGPDVLRLGGEAARVAGFFGNDWTVENGEFVWQ